MEAKREILDDGYSKIVYATDDPERVILHYKDSASAFQNIKRAVIPGKGALACRIAALLFAYLEERGVATHYLGHPAADDLLCRRLTPVPLRVIVRNISAGSIVGRFGIPAGTVFERPVVEINMKNPELDDPILNKDHVAALGIATHDEADAMERCARRCDDLLRDLFGRAGIDLADLKVEFGRDAFGRLYVLDDLSPDTMRLWDRASGQSLDRDRYRRDLGDLAEAYQEVLARLTSAL